MSHLSLQQPFEFLSQLQHNNNREWFNEHKTTYQSAHHIVIAFAEQLHHALSSSDHIETPNGKKSLHRIYRDVRFSKDKTPYSTYFGGGFRRATAALRGGYYYHLEPNHTSIIGGFWNPSTQDLLHIRKQIQQDPDVLRDILNSQSFKTNFGSLEGEQLKTYPRGFDPEDPAIDLLRYKQFLVRHTFANKESLSENFAQIMAEQFKNMRPFLDYMSEILTTDLNGESII
ncbi:DUF2461 domain-containing protein [Reichenbachiella agarivorans]|uniref:DUF2461 domain-containing protein n=1 Tax=Reichenbachiella agarivorans TaxID=2979464 RepID=A0ABY6CU51_9BACT|nr:DUF2461 domain-containing protein [Reichenbachiella agarivorans]UXP33520.1 DUF2461 domain-containing protein [Reichenbachiella agarivorans]